MHPANDGVDFLNTGDDLCLLHGVDHATMAARGDDHQPPIPNEKIGRDFMLEVVRDGKRSNSFPVAIGSGKQPKPSTTPAFILLGLRGFSKLLKAIGPLVKP